MVDYKIIDIIYEWAWNKNTTKIFTLDHFKMHYPITTWCIIYDEVFTSGETPTHITYKIKHDMGYWVGNIPWSHIEAIIIQDDREQKLKDLGI